jgi:hypothetical protein
MCGSNKDGPKYQDIYTLLHIYNLCPSFKIVNMTVKNRMGTHVERVGI